MGLLLLRGRNTPTADLSFLGALPAAATFSRASTATYVASTGVVQSAASGAARIDFDPATLSQKGLLIEESRTNNVYPSVPDSGSRWSYSALSATAAAATAPDGTASAVALTDTTANTNHYVSTPNSFQYVSGTAYVLSFFAKANAQYIVQAALNTQFSNAYANFNLSTGAVTASSGVTKAAMQSFSGGWYRCIVTASATSTGYVPVCISLTGNSASAGGLSYYTGSGNGLYIWGAQVEAGNYQTSYIPATSAAVTRAIDVCYMASPAWLNATSGSFAIDFQHITAPKSGTYPWICNLTDNTSANELGFYVNGSSSVIAAKGTAASTNLFDTSFSGSSYTSGSIAKAGMRYQSANHGYVMNGGTVATNAASAVPAFSRVQLMCESSGSSTPFSGWLRRFRYWNKPLTNSQLQQVTI